MQTKKASTDVKLLKILLAELRALFFIHWTGHWQAKGQSSYGDHLLFERLYADEDESITDEIDALAEKMVAKYGPGVVDLNATISDMERVIHAMPGEGAERSLNAEKLFLKHLKAIYDRLEASGGLSMGLDDFLQGVASHHETNIYLLQQRLQREASTKMASPIRLTNAQVTLLRGVAELIEKYPGRELIMDPRQTPVIFQLVEKGMLFAKKAPNGGMQVVGFTPYAKNHPEMSRWI